MGVVTLYAFFTIFFIFVALVGFIWLVVRAFKTRVWWGLAVLFLSPIGATIYAIKYWYEAKAPYLIYSIAFVVLLVTVPKILFTEQGKEGIERLLADAGIEKPASITAPMREGIPFVYSVVGSVPEKVATLLEDRSGPIWAPASDEFDPRYRAISLTEAKDYIGASMIFVDNNNITRGGTLVGISGNTLRFERRFDAGSVSYEVRAHDIKALKVLVD